MLIVDSDTHVEPSLDVLEPFASRDLRNSWDQLEPYMVHVRYSDEDADRTLLRVNPVRFTRHFGTPSDQDAVTPAGPGSAAAFGAGSGRHITARGVGSIPSGVAQTDSRRRLQDMDEEGVDVHIVIPGPWWLACTGIETFLATSLYSAYHRYAEEYSSPNPRRLKGILLLTGADPQWSAEEVTRHASASWVSAGSVALPEGMAVDDPVLNPIWQALTDAGLPFLYHPFTYEPPYFPGYRDIWGNLAVARSAALPWNAQRLVAYAVMSGMLDRWPTLNICLCETSAGWLPAWLKRIDMNREYLKDRSASARRWAVEYAIEGRIRCGIELYEGPDTVKAVVEQLGPDVLMYSTDYPHPECEWPNSVKVTDAWRSVVTDEAYTKIMGKNAAAALRL